MIRRLLVAAALVTGTAGVTTAAVQVAAPAVSQTSSAPVCILAIQMTAPHYLCIATTGIVYV